ncbi:lysine--tRNA ligase [Candidatus Woesearchaeota archaeon]|nr:lysine--tRNA ligase [Candidatus Woesearchaeota archaeon]
MGEDKLMKERIGKLKQIRNLEIDPYPYNYDAKDKCRELHETYDELKKEEQSKKKAKVAGRVMALRPMGKAAFGNIKDATGKIQFYIKKESAKEDFRLFKLLDIGDIIGVEGEIFKTRTGELTVEVEKLNILSKSLRPLPEKFHGLKDDEIRFRKRYLDLIMNPEVKETFEKRAEIYKAIREFLDKKGFMEVQIPMLQPQYGGANARPFMTNIHAWEDMIVYLRIAYELHLKRLLVGGFEKIYDLSSCFRNEGVDKTHNPEFAMMEVQWAYADYNDAMQLTEELWEYVAKKVNGGTVIEYEGKKIDLKAPWKRLTIKDALKEYADIDVDKLSDDDLKKLVREHKLEGNNRGEWIVELFEELCEDKLIQPVHITDHPRESCPLAKPHRDNPEIVERVEPFINGWEVGNCYSELTDPIMQKKLLKEQVEKGRGGDEEAHPMDEDYIEALEHGLPPNAGIGIGIERMVMLLTGADSIREVILFPIMKPEEK